MKSPKPTNQAKKSLKDFIGRLPRAFLGSARQLPEMPRPRFVLRIGASGHIQVDTQASLAVALGAIFSSLNEYAEGSNLEFHRLLYGQKGSVELSPPELRLVCQLAPGFDQIAATAALPLGYRLHAVLPGNRIAFEHDIQQYCDARVASPQSTSLEHSSNQIATFGDLVGEAKRVLELDRADESSDLVGFTSEDYAQAGAVILNHADIVLIAIHQDASDSPGGTLWMERRAEELDLPVVRIPIERPSDALLVWTRDGRRESRNLFNTMSEGINPRVFDGALNDVLLGAPDDSLANRTGWFEDRVASQLDSSVNATFWDARWALPQSSTSLTVHSLGRVPKQIDDDLRAVAVWADHRASTMAELVRGSFIFCALLGALAVFGALLGLLAPGLSKAGKLLEVACLVVVMCFIWRSRKKEWRSQWLSFRQVERCVDQAAWLLVLGRSRTYAAPAHVSEFQLDDTALWANCYLRAVLRASSFPSARLDADYIRTVQELALHNLIGNQISYYDSEMKSYRRADEVLEAYTMRCVVLAFVVTVLYVVAPYLTEFAEAISPLHAVTQHLAAFSHFLKSPGGPVITLIGALMPAVAAALSAVRSHGEYSQIATRFQGTNSALRAAEKDLTQLLPNRRAGAVQRNLRSSTLVGILMTATDTLVQEVLGWRAILQKKDIEPT